MECVWGAVMLLPVSKGCAAEEISLRVLYFEQEWSLFSSDKKKKSWTSNKNVLSTIPCILSSGHVYMDHQIQRAGYWAQSRMWEQERAVPSHRWNFSRMFWELVSVGWACILCIEKRWLSAKYSGHYCSPQSASQLTSFHGGCLCFETLWPLPSVLNGHFLFLIHWEL